MAEPDDLVWPPVLYMTGLAEQLDTKKKLRSRFPSADDCLPRYGVNGFTREALLIFQSGANAHLSAFATATSLESQCNQQETGAVEYARFLRAQDVAQWLSGPRFSWSPWAKSVSKIALGWKSEAELFGPGSSVFAAAQASFEGAQST